MVLMRGSVLTCETLESMHHRETRMRIDELKQELVPPSLRRSVSAMVDVENAIGKAPIVPRHVVVCRLNRMQI
jgi:hypothetical protein